MSDVCNRLFMSVIFNSSYIKQPMHILEHKSQMSLFVRKILSVVSGGEAQNVPRSEKIYGTLPTSVKETKLLVKAECEEPEVQAARAEIVKSKSVHELSQVTSLSDFPVPEVIENMLKKKVKNLAPAERKKKFKDQ